MAAAQPRTATRLELLRSPYDAVMLSRSGKRVLIVCQLDRFANGQKPVEIQRFLRERGHDARLYDTYYLSRTSTRSGLGLFVLHAIYGLLSRASGWAQSHLTYPLYRLDWHLKRRLFAASLNLDDFDLVICETAGDAAVLSLPTTAETLYDCPTPLADELYHEGRLTNTQHAKFRRRERDLFESVDHLAFHWETYGSYAVTEYGISGRNLMTLNWGCSPSPRRAAFDPNPRIVYLGSLNVRFIDLALLSRLSRIYPYIDVYGGPPPDPTLGLNYLGYASPAILESYQIGLVTCTRDELRCQGFSAKHLDYLSFGLPTLVPSWRKNLELLQGSVPYDEQTFGSLVEMLSDQDSWNRLSDEAYAQAERLAWDETLKPLETLLGASPSTATAASTLREP